MNKNRLTSSVIGVHEVCEVFGTRRVQGIQPKRICSCRTLVHRCFALDSRESREDAIYPDALRTRQ